VRIGFVGTGRLGSQLVLSLLRSGHEVVAHDADPSAARAVLASGAEWAASPAEAAEAGEVLFTCLPRASVVQAVMEGPAGALGGLRPGACWIDCTTTDPDVLTALSVLAAERGAGTLEAPVTGGVHKAARGELTVLVGGEQDLYEAHLRLLECIGSPVIYLGPLGQASRMKVITNMLAFVHLVAAGEALMLAARAGIDLRSAFEAIRQSSGNSFVHETESQVILSGSYDIGFTLDLALKDLGLVRELAEELGVPTELAEAAERRFALAKERYGGDAWSPRVVQLLEDELGTELRAEGFPPTLLGDSYHSP
jgi:3-hydroxyisobutyrate dehydrogenase